MPERPVIKAIFLVAQLNLLFFALPSSNSGHFCTLVWTLPFTAFRHWWHES